jgi:hypothetical protein
MSKIALSGNASGTGTFTIASPNSNSDRTLNLPDNSGTLLTNASTAGFPAGSVLQVVQTQKTDTFSESVSSGGESANVTGLGVSMTPSSSSNKILVSATILLHTEANFTAVTLYRNNSVVFRGDAASSRVRVTSGTDTSNSSFYAAPVQIEFLDSPATTSEVTYTVRLRHTSGITRVCYVNRGTTDNDDIYTFRGTSTITLMEIAA